MARVARLFAGALACVGASPLDEIALVQRSAAQGTVAAEAATHGPIRKTPEGPLAQTTMGPMLGVEEDDHLAFRGIPYAEPPRRFEKAQPKQPWAPKTFSAKVYGQACVGSSTSHVESEDCLHLNVWTPKNVGDEKMPVIVYFHGGLNMHGSGSEFFRQGDGITQSAKFPTIFVNLDYRLGIFGWIYKEPGDNVTTNIGVRDQQMALRWVHDNIAAFGGDPNRVALMGQSEGAGNIMTHLASPGSAGLFYRAIFHSPPAEIWTSDANRYRTRTILTKTGCERSNMLSCLRKVPADQLWHSDWSPEDMSRAVFTPTWFKAVKTLAMFALEGHVSKIINYLGWHAVNDGDVLPGELHDLILEGKWSKVPILLTVSRNESKGVIPGFEGSQMTAGLLKTILTKMFKDRDIDRVIAEYNATLVETGIAVENSYELMHQIMTDKMWTCDAWQFAKEVAKGGGSIYLGGFWHAPKFDPVGTSTNLACSAGATCHAAEMLYSLPQGHGRGVPDSPNMKEELEFVRSYRDNVLSFVSGQTGPWEAYRPDRQVITLVDEHGARAEEGYRQKQCKVLDSSVADIMPEYVKRRAP